MGIDHLYLHHVHIAPVMGVGDVHHVAAVIIAHGGHLLHGAAILDAQNGNIFFVRHQRLDLALHLADAGLRPLIQHPLHAGVLQIRVHHKSAAIVGQVGLYPGQGHAVGGTGKWLCPPPCRRPIESRRRA